MLRFFFQINVSGILWRHVSVYFAITKQDCRVSFLTVERSQIGSNKTWKISKPGKTDEWFLWKRDFIGWMVLWLYSLCSHLQKQFRSVRVCFGCSTQSHSVRTIQKFRRVVFVFDSSRLWHTPNIVRMVIDIPSTYLPSHERYMTWFFWFYDQLVATETQRTPYRVWWPVRFSLPRRKAKIGETAFAWRLRKLFIILSWDLWSLMFSKL